MKRVSGDHPREIYHVALNLVLAEWPNRIKKVLEKFSNLPDAFQSPYRSALMRTRPGGSRLRKFSSGPKKKLTGSVRKAILF
jgi:hypothetical protein